MRTRKFLLGGTSMLAAFVIWQTIHAVGSHVPIEERRWVPPTTAAGMDDGLMLAGHSAGSIGPVPHFDVTNEADGVTAHPQPSAANVDLSALRFFAEQGDEAAMAREIARVERMNPGFEIPEALRRPREGAVEAGLWGLLRDGEFEAARARIAILRQDEGYVPSPDFIAALDAAEARDAIASAHAESRWSDIVAAAGATPHMLNCADPETLWRLGEAYAGMGASDRALAVHAYVLTHCRDTDVRAGSIARAVDVSPAAARDVILPIVSRASAPDGEADAVRRGVARALIAASLGEAADEGAAGAEATCEMTRATGRAARGGDVEAVVSDEAAEELTALAEGAADKSLLGWHHYAAGRFDEAQRWFENALAIEERLEAFEGLILSLKARGERGRALDMALDRGGEDYAACLALGIAAEDLADGSLDDASLVERLSVRLRSADGARVAGWFHVDEGRPAEARAWFGRSLAWRPTAGAAMGLVVAAERSGDRAAAEEAAARWGDKFSQVGEYASAMAQRAAPVPAANPARRSAPRPMKLTPDPAEAMLAEALAAYEAGEFKRAAERLAERRSLVGEPRDLAMLRGWALHNAGEVREAWRLFRTLDAARSTRKTREAKLHAWRAMMPRRFH